MRNRQSGAVLFVAMMMLVILSIIGVTLARMQTVEERMARNDNSRQMAMQAAEAALRNAQAVLANPPSVATFGGNTAGYYALSPATGSMIPTLNWNVAANVTTYTGPALSDLPTLARTPRVVMELMGYGSLAGDDISNPPPTYRITVQGLNADGTPGVILQSIYR